MLHAIPHLMSPLLVLIPHLTLLWFEPFLLVVVMVVVVVLLNVVLVHRGPPPPRRRVRRRRWGVEDVPREVRGGVLVDVIGVVERGAAGGRGGG